MLYLLSQNKGQFQFASSCKKKKEVIINYNENKHVLFHILMKQR